MAEKASSAKITSPCQVISRKAPPLASGKLDAHVSKNALPLTIRARPSPHLTASFCHLPLTHDPVPEGRRTYRHWVITQFAASGKKISSRSGNKGETVHRPRWADSEADPASWTGGMALTHVASGNNEHLNCPG